MEDNWRPIAWRDVKGYEGKYQVSNIGLIRKSNGIIIGQYFHQHGYLIARLSQPRKAVRVHRIVAEAFIDNPEQKPFINHIDCVRSNNVVWNLEWCTQKENLDHARALGRLRSDYLVGKRSNRAKLTDEQAFSIIAEYRVGGTSWGKLAKKYGISKRSVGSIISGRSYVPLPNPPRQPMNGEETK